MRVKAWVDWPDSAEVGPGRAALLRAIRRHGSISVAARTVGIAYRTAWNWIQAMNAVADCPLVAARPGGTRGGGAALTPAGDAVVTALDALHERVAELSAAATAEFTELLERMAGDGVSHEAPPPRRRCRRTPRT
ncbi:MAG: LysR family transcriptional regulator [Deltaproteobacteria bacterium]|nr:LysR family transcriptional regulator [Deltaproteobacteria bacterium]